MFSLAGWVKSAVCCLHDPKASCNEIWPRLALHRLEILWVPTKKGMSLRSVIFLDCSLNTLDILTGIVRAWDHLSSLDLSAVLQFRVFSHCIQLLGPVSCPAVPCLLSLYSAPWTYQLSCNSVSSVTVFSSLDLSAVSQLSPVTVFLGIISAPWTCQLSHSPLFSVTVFSGIISAPWTCQLSHSCLLSQYSVGSSQLLGPVSCLTAVFCHSIQWDHLSSLDLSAVSQLSSVTVFSGIISAPWIYQLSHSCLLSQYSVGSSQLLGPVSCLTAVFCHSIQWDHLSSLDMSAVSQLSSVTVFSGIISAPWTCQLSHSCLLSLYSVGSSKLLGPVSCLTVPCLLSLYSMGSSQLLGPVSCLTVPCVLSLYSVWSVKPMLLPLYYILTS